MADITVKTKGILLALPMLFAFCLGCGRIAERAAVRVGRQAERRGAEILTRDLERDEASKIIRLQTEKRVYKYTTKAEAERMMAEGLPKGSHFTSHISSGRPLGPSHAADRYGLNYKPDTRLSVTIPQGAKVRFNKVVGGHEGGIGEIRIEQSVDSSAISNRR